MSSSGIIYAVIVGAWAVYLVPMWLRREDELNRARQTQRYAAAIKVLANKEAFERRWAKPSEAEAEADEALPLAAGQGSVPIPRTTAKRTSGKATQSGTSSPATIPNTSTKPTKRPVVAAAASKAATAARGAVTANIANNGTRSTRTTTNARAATTMSAATARAPRPALATNLKAPGVRTHTRTGLMARRRRVVALLFTISTLGALVSADLGARYLWVMAVPAVLLSAYIARLRREERVRAATHAAKRAAAQVAREARETELARAQVAEAEAEAARLEAEEAEAMHAHARAEAELRRRTEAARRRASAAARARAQAYTHEAPDLRQASNG